jgi:DNA repair protein SbcC/Rad50
MNGALLTHLDVTNFRSVRGHIHAPLDAKVVLMHGDNGSGKTSLLSAVELGLTGAVQSLRRADPGYATQLLHRDAKKGSVEVGTAVGATVQRYRTQLGRDGMIGDETLAAGPAGFFSERTYLPQSLLGQLLQIYQEAESGSDSPLARFVGDLLGLDRLDALEAGLKPLADVRNVRKVIDRWSQVEIEKTRFDRLIEDQRRSRKAVVETLDEALDRLRVECATLSLSLPVTEVGLGNIIAVLEGDADEKAFAQLTDRRRQLDSMRRENDRTTDVPAVQAEAELAGEQERASSAYAAWEADHGAPITALRNRVEALLPHASLPSDLVAFGEEGLRLLRGAHEQLARQAKRGRSDVTRLGAAEEELLVARRQLSTIDQEVSRIAADSGRLSAVLAEVTSLTADNICPVCDRDYGELNTGPLSEHVHHKVRGMSASAERLLTLGRSRAEQQVVVERLEREIETLTVRRIDDQTLSALDRQTTDLESAIRDLEGTRSALVEGARLLAADVAARRALTDEQQRSRVRIALRDTLTDVALSFGEESARDGETVEAMMDRLATNLAVEHVRLSTRLQHRGEGLAAIKTVNGARTQRDAIDATIADYQRSRTRADVALQRGQSLRNQGLEIRNAVDAVRSAIIRREFNDRLNRLWRDLFVRLAPGEPFVPTFRIPASSTQRLQPKLITEHRDGGEVGGTPGAMLSAGNLNTAALTLFIALHLSVTAQLPWLIFDDPVQSMDDIHIAHFAALLRTLSKEHGRQIIIAVHDRQLFEYLRLELSPAYQDDSLLTLELSRSARRDTMCISRRFGFQEETALLAA